MKLYLSNGYANMPDIIQTPTPFILVIGGRGTGKTYTSIKFCLENNIKFIYLRRTAAQMELVSKDEFSPIIKVASDIGMALTSETISKYVSGVYHIDEDGKPTGSPVAVNMALSVVANMRSYDSSDVRLLIFDECIPEKHERQITHEKEALLNCIESISRNRELQGGEPLKVLCLANANNLEAPVLQALNCVRTLDQMRKKGMNQKVDKSIGLSIFLLNDSPISAEKRETALYKLTMGTGDFTDMALNNAFSRDNYTDIGNRPLNEYIPIASIGSICVYRHKSNWTWYISETKSGKPVEFENTITDRVRFKKYVWQSWIDYFDRKLVFENVTAKVAYKAIMLENLK